MLSIIHSKSTVYILIFLYAVVNLIYAFFFPVPYLSDSQNYLNFATNAIHDAQWYPSINALYNEWIAAPVYVNCLIVLLKIFHTTTAFQVFNAFLNITQLLLMYRLTVRFFGEKSGFIVVLIYILYLNNLGLVLLNYTELLYGVLILGAINLFFQQNKVIFAYFCGLTLGLALGVRPTAYSLILGILVLYGIDIFHQRANHLRMFLLVLGIATFVFIQGTISKQNIGQFVYSSTTGPANLVMSANDKATGVYDNTIFKKDSILLSKKTYVEKNKYLQKRSLDWMKAHPTKWLSLIPRKIYSTFIADDFAITPLLGSNEWSLNKFLKDKNHSQFSQEPTVFRGSFLVLQTYHQLYYLIILVIILYQLFLFVKEWKKVNSLEILINIYIFTGIALTFIGSVGNPRYKYSFFTILFILIAPIISKKMVKKVSQS
jgi:hypothetical protein